MRAYCLLRAILKTGDQGRRPDQGNPCRIRGYGKYHTPEQSTAQPEQVYELAEVMPARFSALIVPAAFTGRGQLVVLCRSDLDAGTVKVPRELAALRSGLELDAPKSEAGVRVVALPEAALKPLRRHLADLVDDHPGALVFTESGR